MCSATLISKTLIHNFLIELTDLLFSKLKLQDEKKVFLLVLTIGDKILQIPKEGLEFWATNAFGHYAYQKTL